MRAVKTAVRKTRRDEAVQLRKSTKIGAECATRGDFLNSLLAEIQNPPIIDFTGLQKMAARRPDLAKRPKFILSE
jgi:hypothetical protein